MTVPLQIIHSRGFPVYIGPDIVLIPLSSFCREESRWFLSCFFSDIWQYVFRAFVDFSGWDTPPNRGRPRHHTQCYQVNAYGPATTRCKWYTSFMDKQWESRPFRRGQDFRRVRNRRQCTNPTCTPNQEEAREAQSLKQEQVSEAQKGSIFIEEESITGRRGGARGRRRAEGQQAENLGHLLGGRSASNFMANHLYSLSGKKATLHNSVNHLHFARPLILAVNLMKLPSATNHIWCSPFSFTLDQISALRITHSVQKSILQNEVKLNWFICSFIQLPIGTPWHLIQSFSKTTKVPSPSHSQSSTDSQYIQKHISILRLLVLIMHTLPFSSAHRCSQSEVLQRLPLEALHCSIESMKQGAGR